MLKLAEMIATVEPLSKEKTYQPANNSLDMISQLRIFLAR